MKEIIYDSENKAIIDAKTNNKLQLRGRNVYLILFKSGQQRLLGTINNNTRTIHVTRNREKHLFRKSDSYGFNENLMKLTNSFDYILLKDNYGQYRFHKNIVIKYGEYMNFKQQGFELQLFLPLKKIQEYKVGESL